MGFWQRRRHEPVDPHGPGNVFDLLLAQILKDKGQPVAHVIVDRIGDQHPAGIGQGLDARGDVDAVAVKVVALDDYIAEIDADAQLDAAVCRDTRVPPGHCLLHRDRAAHRIDDARKFDQHAVAGGLDDAAVVFGDFRIDEFPAQCLEAFERAFLVRPISREYGATSAASMAASRRSTRSPLKGLCRKHPTQARPPCDNISLFASGAKTDQRCSGQARSAAVG
jgi:hypothetical protein